MKTNTKRKSPAPKTHEGAPAKRIGKHAALERSVMSAFLWESEFYEDGESIADRIKTLVAECDPALVAHLAIKAREEQHLRHMPLLLLRELARHPKLKDHPQLLSRTLARVCQRADEPAEFLSLYWSEGRCPVSKQVRRGLAWALRRFNEYELAKYNREGSVTLKDVLFVTHAKPKEADEVQMLDESMPIPGIVKGQYRRGQVFRHENSLYHKIVANKLEVPDTWEVALSQGGRVEGMDQVAYKKQTFERLIKEGKLGYLALLRNLRNMVQADVDEKLIRNAIQVGKGAEKVLPFRYIAAARHAPQFENVLDISLQNRLDTEQKLPGKTIVLVDVSGSMDAQLSGKSDMKRLDAACGVAMIARALSDSARVFAFSNSVAEVPARHGMALARAISDALPHGGTELGGAIRQVTQYPHDRLIVVTDEQSHDPVGAPKVPNSYMINVASAQNGVGYGPWVHIDGFSESVIRFIQEYERNED